MISNRESGIELLRILSMLAIVSGHFVSQGMIDVYHGGFLSLFVSSACRIAVDIFLIIGCWFMVDAKFSVERIVRIYAQVCVYSIPLTLLMLALGEAGGVRNLIQGCVPFFGRSVWFASAYISLLALTPFLNSAFDLPRVALGRLVMVLFVLFCLVSTIPQFTAFEYLADFAWFPVVYLSVGWAKHYGFADRLPRPCLSLIIAGLLYSGLCAALLSPLEPLARYWLENIRGLPCVACAVLVFNAFRRIDLGRNVAVNIVARSSFAVYIFHQVPAFHQFLWELFGAAKISTYPAFTQTLGIVTTAMTVFTAASILDVLRLRFLEPFYMRSRPVKFLIGKIEGFYRGSGLVG